MLVDVLPVVQKLIRRENLSAEETRKAIVTLAKEDFESYYYFVFTAALHTKGETSDELLGFSQATEQFVPQLEVGFDPERMIDTSGTGGGDIKTLNVGTAAAFILRSKGAHVAKQAFAGVTSPTGSADLLEAFGIDPREKISFGGPPKVLDILNSTGMVTYVAHFLARPEDIPGTLRWVERRQEIGLNFPTVYHLAANAYSAIPMKRRLYGVYDPDYLVPVAELFQKLGYTRGIVCHGEDGLDEMSNIGPTKIAEFSESSIEQSTLTPSDLGVQRASPGDIEARDREGNIRDFLRVLYGRDRSPKRDLVAINAGAAFYVLGDADNFENGTRMAIRQLENGEAARAFEAYVEYCGKPAKLRDLRQAYQV